jgi:AcrR family transcriptional regulator
MSRAPERSRPARARLLAAAANRFYADGITATGVDTIASQAGVAKMSLYNNFPSKAALVEAYLDERHVEWLELYEGRSIDAGKPADYIVAVFDAYIDHASLAYEHGFRGCGLLNAAAELPAGHPGREIVRRHKEEVEAILRSHLSELTDRARASRLAEHLSFLLEGSMARAGLEGQSDRLVAARALAEEMVKSI